METKGHILATAHARTGEIKAHQRDVQRQQWIDQHLARDATASIAMAIYYASTVLLFVLLPMVDRLKNCADQGQAPVIC